MITTIWRLSRFEYHSTAFSGEGARIAGGRWNSKGVRVVYVSCNQALAVLETFVHMRLKPSVRMDYVLFKAEIPGYISIDGVFIKDLPEDWYKSPAPEALASIGDNWISEGRTAVLRVPSVIVCTEYNYLLNPSHRDFSQIRVYPYEQFVFDQRLLDMVEVLHKTE